MPGQRSVEGNVALALRQDRSSVKGNVATGFIPGSMKLEPGCNL